MRGSNLACWFDDVSHCNLFWDLSEVVQPCPNKEAVSENVRILCAIGRTYVAIHHPSNRHAAICQMEFAQRGCFTWQNLYSPANDLFFEQHGNGITKESWWNLRNFVKLVCMECHIPPKRPSFFSAMQYEKEFGAKRVFRILFCLYHSVYKWCQRKALYLAQKQAMQ